MAEFDRKKILLISVFGFSLILLVVFTVFLVSFLLRKGEVFKPPQSSEEFPPSPAANFPPAPQFINIAGLYFSGPLSADSLKEQSSIYSSGLYGLYTVLCKKNGEYDIIYLGETGREEPEQKCLLENCQQNSKNLYFAFLWTPKESYVYNNKGEILKFLLQQVKPICLSQEKL